MFSVRRYIYLTVVDPLVAVAPEALWSQLELHFIFGGEMSVRMTACLSAV